MDALFSTEVIACLLIAGASAFAISVVLRFRPDRDRLDRNLRKTERALERIQKQIAARQGRIKQLKEEVAALVPVHHRLQAYHEELLQIQVEEERKALEEGGKEQPGRQIKKKQREWDGD